MAIYFFLRYHVQLPENILNDCFFQFYPDVDEHLPDSSRKTDHYISEKTPLSHPIPAKTMWTCATGLSIRDRKRNMDLGWTWHHFAYWTGFPSMRSCPCSCRERRDASTVSQEMASNPEVLGIPIAGDPNLSGIICLIINNGIVMAHLRCFFFLSGEMEITTAEKVHFHFLDRLAAVMQPFALTQ